MKSKTHSNTRTQGGVLIVAVLTVTILAIAAAGVLSYVGSKYRNLSQAMTWRKAVVAAESGVDFGMQTLTNAVSDPNGAWTGWSTTNPTTGTTLPNSGKCYTATAMTFGGQGGNSMNFYVVVDIPASLASTVPTKQYYRIRSTGYADLSGGRVVTNDSLDTNLRKLSLRIDRFTRQTLTTPRAARTIEVVAAPQTEIIPRNVASVGWNMDAYKNDTRAFDSSDPNYSTNGRWDPTKQVPSDKAGVLLGSNQWNKNYEKKGTLTKEDLKHSTVWGDFAVMAGPVKNGENIQGQTFEGVDTVLPKVLAPSWTSLTDPSINKIEGNPTSAQKAAFNQWFAQEASPALQATTLTSGKNNLVLRGSTSATSPAKYKIQDLKIDSGDKSVALANPTGTTESWIEIWATDEFTVKNGATLAVQNGVHATIHFAKKLKIKDTKKDSGGTFVESGFAGDLVFRGIELPESDKETDADFSPVKTSGLVKVKNSNFTGVVFAPDYDMDLSSKNAAFPASQQYILGAVVGRKVHLKGDTDFITDLALTRSGAVITGYRVASWFEDSE